ncbi:hypothetical protein L6R52_01100 [Myxococcota bacterium]|nr:hypothetical protein [Myxococcota bacterium]
MTEQLFTAVAFLLPSTVAIAAAPIYRLRRSTRTVAVALVITALLPLPMLVPLERGVLRAVAAIVVLMTSAKLFDLHQQREPHPGFVGHFAFVLHPFSAVLRRLDGEPAPSRAENLRRLARGVVHALAGGAVLVWLFTEEVARGSIVVDHVLKLFAFYIGLEGTLVALVSLARLSGVKARDVLEQPYLAITPADFWRRYNRVIGQFLHEDVFRRSGGLRAPVRATIVTFVVSAIAHEYLFSIALGRIEGYQTAFFLLQGLAVALTVRVRPEGRWRWVALAATLTFNVATSFLFYRSVDQLQPWFLR